MTASAWISEADDLTFDSEVVERSRRIVVVVDFWAAWCGPCRSLTPILEAAVEARKGDVHLVKVDVDQSPRSAARFGVRGVPAVKAFVDGEVRRELVGLQSRAVVDAFLAGVVPAAEEVALARASELVARLRPEAVEAALQPALQSPRHRDRALLVLGRARGAARQYGEARAALDEVPETSPEAEAARGLRLKLDLEDAAEDRDREGLRARLAAAPDDSDARWALAGLELGSGNVREALELLLEILKRDRRYRDDGARRAMLAIFDEIGVHHEISNELRRQMQIYL